MAGVRLLSLDSVGSDVTNSKHEYELETEKEYVVGRDKSADILIDDKRCSRKQAILCCDDSGLSVTPLGTNPCFVCSRNEDPISLAKKEATKLQHNDKICFLALEFPFLVRYPRNSNDDDESMEDEIISEEEEDERPHCKYGAKCYRANPDHVRKFYHPHKDLHGNPRAQPKAQSSDDESDDMEIEIEISEESSPTVEQKAEKKGAITVKNVKEISAPGTRIIAEEDEELLAEKKREVNRQIAEKQAKIFKQNVTPRKIEVTKPKESQEKKIEKKEVVEQNTATEMKKSEYLDTDLAYSLLFPPLCIDSSSQYDVSKASKIMAKEILKFLHTYSETKEIRVTLLDDPVQPLGELVTKYLHTLYEKNKLPVDNRFSVITENSENFAITSQRFLVCPVTWRFKPNHHISRDLFKNHKEIVSEVQRQAKQKHLTAKVGETYQVLLPELCDKTQVLLLVNGPNISNTKKPNCLQGDYKKGAAHLESCYSSLFNHFASLCGLEEQ